MSSYDCRERLTSVSERISERMGWDKRGRSGTVVVEVKVTFDGFAGQFREPSVVEGGFTVNNESNTQEQGETRRKERRGFASMSPEKQREIASKGGRAAHMKGTAHEWSSEEARAAGRKGGRASRGGRGRLPEGGAAE